MADDSCSKEACKRQIMAVHDAMDVLNGKWRIFILAVLSYHAHRRFSDLLNDIHGISNKMLSKELKDMEMNRLVKRTVLNTQPIAVQYELTEYGQSLKSVIDNLSNWGVEHRKKIIMEQ
jgi:DNA-binding HxlR family transcriptional regulator